jgi:hypothetical protein
MFAIGFTDEPVEHPNEDERIAAPGMLVLGKTMEEFLANLGAWNKNDYRSHWLTELKALVNGRSNAVLIVDYNDPAESSNLEVWKLYRNGEQVYFQNQLLFCDALPPTFVVSEIASVAGERKTENEDGDRFSEWMVSLREIEMFMMRTEPLTITISPLQALND